jgi:aspartyl-tRNA(Asn)/glutamyl-tRNA(Gln) amidotransferase subunit C
MTVTIEEVKKLAELSRIELGEEEIEKMRGEIDAIVAYIDIISQVDLPEGVAVSPHLALENVMRSDDGVHEAGIYTEKMLSQAPKRDGKFVKVKKILG